GVREMRRQPLSELALQTATIVTSPAMLDASAAAPRTLPTPPAGVQDSPGRGRRAERYALRRGRHCSHARRAGNRPEKVVVQSGAIHLQFPILSRSPALPGTLAGTRRGKLGFNAWRNAMNISRIRPAKLVSAMLAGSLALSVLIGPAFVPPNMVGSVARAEVSIGIDVFQRDLSPYGQWVDSPNYGQVWYPVGVQQGWRPYYNDGHWEYSDDYGWIWVSDLPWGWAAFHYGRWAFDPNYG